MAQSANGSAQVQGGGNNKDSIFDPSVVSGGTQQLQVSGTDDLLDEIDSLLESNAEEFVRSYVQKGGQ